MNLNYLFYLRVRYLATFLLCMQYRVHIFSCGVEFIEFFYRNQIGSDNLIGFRIGLEGDSIRFIRYKHPYQYLLNLLRFLELEELYILRRIANTGICRLWASRQKTLLGASAVEFVSHSIINCLVKSLVTIV